MRVVIFCHSLLSDWNHGNAHFLRGIASELIARGHTVRTFEPRDAWSRVNLEAEHGRRPIEEFRRAYPELSSTRYDPRTFDPARALSGADLAIVHEWNDPALVAAVAEARAGLRRRSGGCVLLFHDTHHRSVTRPADIASYDLRHYDGVLAFGDPIRDAYLRNRWAVRAWTWHEAADVRRFAPRPRREAEGDLVWIGNWGDDERTEELRAFLVEPVRRLGISARVYGVRYPAGARRLLADAGIEYGGWLPNCRVPDVFSRFRATVHIPRAPYVRALPGIPTIRPFEALACGIPLVVALWDTAGDLFTPGEDYLIARTGREMEAHLAGLLDDPGRRERLAARGRATILARHTCAHRVDELLAIADEVREGWRPRPASRRAPAVEAGDRRPAAPADGAAPA